jgi:hypothetical protein
LDNVRLDLVKKKPLFPSGVSPGVFRLVKKNIQIQFQLYLYCMEVRAFISFGLKQKCFLLGAELEFFVPIQEAYCFSSVRL